jgi:hypothetical protein
MTSKPPLVAAWLLRYLNDTPHFDSMMGDLEEFRVEGRSQAWYWRQTFVAVASHFVREIRSYKLLAFRGLAVTWALMPAYNVGRLIALKALVAGRYFIPLLDIRRTLALDVFETSFQEIPRSLGHVGRIAGSPYLVAACAILFLIALIFGTATSVLVGRLHPKHHKTMIVLYALTMLITVLPNAGSLAVAAYSLRTFGTVLHALVYCANNTALITGIVLGGFLYQRATERSNRRVAAGCSRIPMKA